MKTLKEILGQRFLDEPLVGREGKEGLPSPEELKYKILLKVSRWKLLSFIILSKNVV